MPIYFQFCQDFIKNNYRGKTRKENVQYNTSAGAVYGLGLIGASIYFISTATGFWIGVLGFLKTTVWLVFMIYESFKYLGA